MPIKIIGKSVLGELGFSLIPSKMRNCFKEQLQKIEEVLPWPNEKVFMTSMTSSEEVKLTNGAYFPKLLKIYPHENLNMFNPCSIYHYCELGKDKFRPKCDFIVWNSVLSLAAATFSREAPILAFESEKGKALGTILRPSLMKYGDYLFSSIKEELGDKIQVTIVTCNHFEYPEGSIPSIVQSLAVKYDMSCVIGENSEENSECYHRGEKGNHIVVMW